MKRPRPACCIRAATGVFFKAFDCARSCCPANLLPRRSREIAAGKVLAAVLNESSVEASARASRRFNVKLSSNVVDNASADASLVLLLDGSARPLERFRGEVFHPEVATPT